MRFALILRQRLYTLRCLFPLSSFQKLEYFIFFIQRFDGKEEIQPSQDQKAEDR